MSQAFKTFGTIRENLYQSDYINRKKKSVNCCKVPPPCPPPCPPPPRTPPLPPR